MCHSLKADVTLHRLLFQLPLAAILPPLLQGLEASVQPLVVTELSVVMLETV